MSRFGDHPLEGTTAEFVLVHGMRHGACAFTPVDLDTAHGPMRSAPEGLVRVLRSL